MRAFIDSDILIWHLRGELKALKFLKKIRAKSEYELWIGAMQRAEVVFFMRLEDRWCYIFSQCKALSNARGTCRKSVVG